MSIVTTDEDKGFKNALREIELAESWGELNLKVGVQELEGSKQHPEAKEIGASVAEIATMNEFGTKRIPARSFIRSTMFENHAKFSDLNDRLLGKVAMGKASVMQALNLLGLAISSAIKRKITMLRTPPNAPSTIAKKGSDNPLIDTGHLRAVIRHEVTRSGDNVA